MKSALGQAFSQCNKVRCTMADHKRQHFVPQFYLRRFSQNRNSINMFNIKSERSISDSQIKGQCYRDYFYGKDRVLENALSQLEGEMSRILKSIPSQGMLPERPSHDLHTFLTYVLLQHSRTEQFIGAHEAQIERSVKHLVDPHMLAQGFSPQDLAKIRITLKEPAGFVLKQTAILLPLFLDLDCTLVRITNDQEFITSDSPVVFYNQLLPFQGIGGSGIASKGLQVFFPLDPKHLAILYDSDVYRVGKPGSRRIEISNSVDVYELNRLQFAHALHNVYFSTKTYPVLKAYDKSRKYRTPIRLDVRNYPVKVTDKGRGEIFTISQYRPRTDLKLSFVKCKEAAKDWRRGFRKSGAWPLRSPARDQGLVDEHKIFIKFVETGRYQVNEFVEFLRERHPR